MTTKRYIIDIKETTDLLIEESLLNKLDIIFKENNYSAYLLLCDKTTKKLFVKKAYASLQKLNVPVEIHELPVGEESKNTTNLFRILEHIIERGFDRKSAVIALGGGVVGDIATTAAALYHRGIDCIQIPTTLLAQVDAAIGGKGAVNVRNYKNIVGIIRQPRHLLIDPTLLYDLPERETKSGIGEVIKYAIALDYELFEILEKNHKDIMPFFPDIITRCINAKMAIVQKDPYEKRGHRQLLNFGHTLGHAIELYAHLTHGEAVAIGMAFAIKASQKLQMLTKGDAVRAINLLKTYHLPTTLSKKLITKETIYEHMRKDKKAINNIPTFVLLESIGKVKTGCTISKDIIEQVLEEILV